MSHRDGDAGAPLLGAEPERYNRNVSRGNLTPHQYRSVAFVGADQANIHQLIRNFGRYRSRIRNDPNPSFSSHMIYRRNRGNRDFSRQQQRVACGKLVGKGMQQSFINMMIRPWYNDDRILPLLIDTDDCRPAARFSCAVHCRIISPIELQVRTLSSGIRIVSKVANHLNITTGFRRRNGLVGAFTS